jgi:3-oxoacyl-[acyl-carrier-protein] synthase-3
MAIYSIRNVAVCGIAASVPKNTEDNLDMELLTVPEREMFVKTVGIRYRRIAPAGLTASDLCYTAAEKLIDELGWEKDEIVLLVFVSQTPDYLIPNTSSVLQNRLGLTKQCLAFDVNLGCSGYTYGLSIVAAQLAAMQNGKALLLVGDIASSTISREDKSVTPLFADAGSATAMEYVAGAGIMHFNLQTDGAGYKDIFIPDGGMRNPFSASSLTPVTYEKNVVRNALNMRLDGVNIFNFALREVVPNIRMLYEKYGLSLKETDYFIFHQANKLMLESIRKKLALEQEKVPYSLYYLGNTSAATIPVTIVNNLKNKLSTGNNKLLLSGFGVGLSWGSVYAETLPLCIPSLIEV